MLGKQRMFARIFRNLAWGEHTRILGRWNYNQTARQLDQKIYLANHDHCGPCGSLTTLKNLKLVSKEDRKTDDKTHD